jgi:hypothetical protein
MELGPIQKAWIASLRAHPERQMTGKLGERRSNGTYQACCLGEGGLIAGVCHWNASGTLESMVETGNSGTLGGGAYNSLGLYGPTGKNKKKPMSLSSINDAGTSWSEIADMLEDNPEDWFQRSV